MAKIKTKKTMVSKSNLAAKRKQSNVPTSRNRKTANSKKEFKSVFGEYLDESNLAAKRKQSNVPTSRNRKTANSKKEFKSVFGEYLDESNNMKKKSIEIKELLKKHTEEGLIPLNLWIDILIQVHELYDVNIDGSFVYIYEKIDANKRIKLEGVKSTYKFMVEPDYTVKTTPYVGFKEVNSEKESTVKKESVNHPSHYGGDTTYEAIKVIEAWELGFNLGNTAKYISRAGKKDPDKTIEDLKKAKFYLDREISNLEKSNA